VSPNGSTVNYGNLPESQLGARILDTLNISWLQPRLQITHVLTNDCMMNSKELQMVKSALRVSYVRLKDASERVRIVPH
jgi:hypothetical protein